MRKRKKQHALFKLPQANQKLQRKPILLKIVRPQLRPRNTTCARRLDVARSHAESPGLHLRLVLAELGRLLLLVREQCLGFLPARSPLLDAAEHDDNGGQCGCSQTASGNANLGAIGQGIVAVLDPVWRLDLFEHLRLAPAVLLASRLEQC